jgi:1-acyl-sn-glycerol-3-phosphate acyltransferase
VRRLFLRIGGIPINRRAATGVIGELLNEFRRRDWMWLAIAPEGTRSYTDHLKSGFYLLAREADVPVGLGYIDYARRHIGIDEYVRMTGDVEADLARLRAFYADKRGYAPERAGQLRFRRGSTPK